MKVSYAHKIVTMRVAVPLHHSLSDLEVLSGKPNFGGQWRCEFEIDPAVGDAGKPLDPREAMEVNYEAIDRRLRLLEAKTAELPARPGQRPPERRVIEGGWVNVWLRGDGTVAESAPYPTKAQADHARYGSTIHFLACVSRPTRHIAEGEGL